MHYSAKRGIAIACRDRLSVTPSVRKSRKLIARTISQTPLFFVGLAKGHPPILPGEHGEIWGQTRAVGWEKVVYVLEQKRGNISEMRKD